MEFTTEARWLLTHHWAGVTNDDLYGLDLPVPRRSSELNALKRTLSEIALADRANMAVWYSPQPGAYRGQKRYHPSGFSHVYINRIIDRLEVSGLVAVEQLQSGMRRGRVLIRSTQQLREKLQHLANFQFDPTEIIILEDADGRPLPYADTPAIQLRRLKLLDIGKKIAALALTIPGIDFDHDVVCFDNAVIFPKKRALLRRFQGQWDIGGSVSDTLIGSLPSSAVAALQIDGEPIAIIDLTAAYPRLLSALHVGLDNEAFMAGADLPEHVWRTALKALLFASSDRSAIKTLKEHLSTGEGSVDAALVIARLKERYQHFTSSFCSGIGPTLQCLLADLSIDVVSNAQTRGLPTLLHQEQLIVPQSKFEVIQSIVETLLGQLLTQLKR